MANLHLPRGINNVGDNAFYGANIKNLSYNLDTCSVVTHPFYFTTIGALNVGSNVSKIPSGMFDNTNVTNMIINNLNVDLEKEFNAYRERKTKELQSDFDLMMKSLPNSME